MLKGKQCETAPTSRAAEAEFREGELVSSSVSMRWSYLSSFTVCQEAASADLSFQLPVPH